MKIVFSLSSAMSIPTHIEQIINNPPENFVDRKIIDEICDNLHHIIRKYDRDFVNKLFLNFPEVKYYFFAATKYSSAICAWEEKYGSAKKLNSMPKF